MKVFNKMMVLGIAALMTTSVFAAKAEQSNAAVTPKIAAQQPALININTASAEQLQQVKGLGPQKAQSIVEYRQQHGNFTSVDQLNSVKGISDKLIAKIKGQVTV